MGPQVHHRPWLRTTIRSARSMVERRWAMTSVVRPRRRALERCLDPTLGLGVQGGGRLVEDQDGGVLEQRAGNREPLALPPREPHPRSPIRVANPSGSRSIKSSAWAVRAASRNASSLAAAPEP